jgi:transposase, IS30 family
MSGACLTLEERYSIYTCTLAQLPVAQIAQGLGRHRASIYAELARGRDRRGRYCPHRGQRRRDSASRRSAGNQPRKSAQLWCAVHQQVLKRHSPEQIAGRRRLLGELPVSAQAIYNYLQGSGRAHWLRRARLRRHLQRPARRPWQGSQRPIGQRAAQVLARLRCGDWETDSAIGKRSDVQRTLVTVERQTLYTQLRVLPRPDAQLAARLIARDLRTAGLPFHSITSDRGWEFSALGEVFADQAFACNPHCPNERGTNENQIGLAREYLPKGVSMDTLQQRRLTRIARALNDRPRKSLGYLTPNEVMFNRPPPFVVTRT